MIVPSELNVTWAMPRALPLMVKSQSPVGSTWAWDGLASQPASNTVAETKTERGRMFMGSWFIA